MFMYRSQRLGLVALWLARCATLYPLVTVGAAQLHYAITSENLSRKTEASLMLFTFPICLASAFAFIVAFSERGRTRTLIIVWALIGVVLNIALFVTTGISD
jgi:hypothetical protein